MPVSTRDAVWSGRERSATRYHGRHHAARRQATRSASVYPYTAALALLIVVYPWLGSTPRMLAFSAVAFASIPAAVVGLRRAQETERATWRLLLIALISLNVGNAAWYWYVRTRHVLSADRT